MVKRKIHRVPVALSQDEATKILKALGNREEKFVAMRNSMMFLTGYYLGLRPKEFRCIEKNHLNFQDKTLFIPAFNNKQRNEDIIPIPDFLVSALLNYTKKIPFKTRWLFPSFWSNVRKEDKPVNQRTFEIDFNRAVKEAGLQRISHIDNQGMPRYTITAYALRHSFGSNIYRKTKDVMKVGTMLRHYDNSFRSSLRYVHTNDKEKRREILNELYETEKQFNPLIISN